MKDGRAKTVRCVIYTRVSTDHGLEQDFNSLDAQREASEAYIKSQAHAGWVLGKARYDDGGFSGGNTDRPALQQLLEDIKARRVDVIVVYKVDRLTRSLADFAKLVELFDAHGVSFVSVTQAFNTTTSMGRLTLNVLLSFAQFEREVTSERIRDKMAASKRKGLWVGGMAPLGYEVKDRKVLVVEEEAKRVRTIFRRYLELGSVDRLVKDLSAKDIRTKARTYSSGKRVGGIPFTKGPLAYLLRNRFYIGEVLYKGEILPGSQPAILDRDLFDRVQAHLDQRRAHHRTRYQRSEALLMGRIFDDRGNRMSPTFSVKNGVRLRYYATPALAQKHAGSIRRASATQVEQLVVDALRKHLPDIPVDTSTREFVHSHVLSVTVHSGLLLLRLKNAGNETPEALRDELHDNGYDTGAVTIEIPWSKRPAKRKREIVSSTSTAAQQVRPIQAKTRSTLVSSIARGRRWLDELVRGEVISIEQIAKRERCSVRQVSMTVSLAFLAPSFVKAAVEGRLPRGIGVEQLRDAAAEWPLQRQMLGFADQRAPNG